MTHANFPPSSLGRFLKCNAAWHVQIKRPPHSAANLGSLQHDYAANYMKYLLGQSQHFDDRVEDEIEIEMVKDAVKSAMMIVAGADPILIEEIVSLPFVPVELTESDFYGTVDVLAVKEQTLHILDYKFGRLNVEPDCVQLKAYGFLALKTAEFQNIDIDNVVLTIIQPYNGGVKQYSIEPQPIMNWGESVIEEIHKIKKISSLQKQHFNPGPEQCSYCPYTGQCRALHMKIEEVGFFKPELTISELADVWRNLAAIRSKIANTESDLKKILKKQAVDGLKLKTRHSRRTLKGPAIEQVIQKNLGDAGFKKVPQNLSFLEKKLKEKGVDINDYIEPRKKYDVIVEDKFGG